MHRAPAVSYPVGRSSGQLIAIVSLISLGGLALLFLAQEIESASLLLLLFCLAAAAVPSLDSWLSFESELLQWNGHTWHLSRWSDATEVGLSLVLDLQFLILVEITSRDGQQAWLWIESQQFAPRWLALRRAVLSGQHIGGDESDRLET